MNLLSQFNQLNQRSKVLLFGLVISASLSLFSLLLPTAQLSHLYHASGFYLLFASFIYWVYLLLPRNVSSESTLRFIKQYGWVLLLFTGLTALMFLSSPLQFRILADETNLLGIANSMYSEHDFANRTEALYYFHQQHEVSSKWGIRPNFFPFLIYTLHSIKGYSAYNGFIINFFAGLTSLWCMYWLLSRWFQQGFALLGALMLAAFPVFVLWVTSSGFEIVNVALALLAFCWLYQYQATRDGYHLERLVLTLVLLAQTRYESAIFVLAIGLVVIAGLRWPHFEKLSMRCLVLPWFFLPVAWQRLLKTNKSDYQVYNNDAIFSWDIWLSHLQPAWHYFSATEARFGTISVVFYLAIGGLFIAVLQLYRLRRTLQPTTLAIIVAAALSLALLIAVVFSYYWGNLSASFTIRLGIIFLPFMIALAIFALQQLWLFSKHFIANNTHPNKALMVTGLALCLFYWPEAGKNQAAQQLTLNRQYQSVLGFLQQHYPQPNLLIVTDRPGLYSVHRWGAVNFNYALRHQQRLRGELTRKLYQEILIIQLIDYASGKAIKNTDLKADFALESVFETQFNATAKLRISRVIVD